jgi:HPr kinase/phosphorylase
MTERVTTPELSVRAMLADPALAVSLRLVAGAAGVDRPIRHPRIQKPGLALAGHFWGVVPTRVQILGETELSYLDARTPEERERACRGFLGLGLSCVVITRAGPPDAALVAASEETGTPLCTSDSRSSRTINALHALLDERLAPRTTLHGVLVDVFGVGVLILGKSGIGKSECALELVLRGHRLVADDVVHCDWRPPGMIFGGPAELLRDHIEIRGLGVLDVKALFGVTSVLPRKRIDLVLRLEDWREDGDYDRLGVEDRTMDVLGTPIRELRVPVRPGRDMGALVELAARGELLRREGRDVARDFLERIDARAGTKAAMDAPRVAAVPPPPESVAPGPLVARSRGTGLGAHDAHRTESSGYLPAVKPREGSS